ncbi:MAG TPA: hypothetical protein VJQ56_16820 [Blastocatellia bacterium]|nr:hypothetical protein [Blastocatellia bacterium]
MKISPRLKKTGSLLVSIILLVTIAQPVRTAAEAFQDATDEENVNFDNLLPADTYGIYGEVRSIGQQVKQGGVTDLLDPLMPLIGQLPRELSEIIDLVREHANDLARSRMMIATVPVRHGLPQIIFALELASPDAAKEFEPHFKKLIASVFLSGDRRGGESLTEGARPATPFPFFLKQAGNLILVADAPFTIKALRGEGNNLLSNDINFRDARGQFSHETVFFYFDMKLSRQQVKQRTEQVEKTLEDETKRINETRPPHSSSQTARVNVPEFQVAETRTGEASKAEAPQSEPRESSRVYASSQPSRHLDIIGNLLGAVFSLGYSGHQSYDSIAVALAVENDMFVLRALIANTPGAQSSVVPFFPFLIFGSAQPMVSAGYLPDDTDIVITGSLDLPKMYATSQEFFGSLNTPPAPVSRHNRRQATFESRAAAFEKKYKIRIKEEILPALGSEVTFALPARMLLDLPAAKSPAPPQPERGPVMLVSVLNKEALEGRVAPLLELLGLKTAVEKAKLEKQGSIQINSYNNVSFAFVDNYLVIALDADAVRRVLIAHAQNKTLASNRDFHSYTRWQPRSQLGQVYISSEIMKSIIDLLIGESRRDEKFRLFFEQLNPVPEPITYAVSQEGNGARHEVRLSKQLLILFFATLLRGPGQSVIASNESIAVSLLGHIQECQSQYFAKHKRYGTLEELTSEGLLEHAVIDGYGYKFEITANGNRYEATATPLNYGVSGGLSFFTDETNALRSVDNGGKPATAADRLQQELDR